MRITDLKIILVILFKARFIANLIKQPRQCIKNPFCCLSQRLTEERRETNETFTSYVGFHALEVMIMLRELFVADDC